MKDVIEVPTAALNIIATILATLANALERQPENKARVLDVVVRLNEVAEDLREMADKAN